MIRQYLSRFMLGRYGMDELNGFLLGAYLVLYVLSALFRVWILDVIGLVFLVVALFRMFSRHLDARRRENNRFLQVVRPLLQKYRSTRTRMQDREHRYFRCPNCGQQMRVPRGKGRITVHCRSCGATFEERS